MSYFPHIKAPATMSGNPLIEFLRHCVNNQWSIHPHGHLSMPEHHSPEFRLWNYTIPFFPICLAAVEFGFSFKLAMNYSCDCANLDLCISSETLSNFCEKSVKNILLLNASYFLSEDHFVIKKKSFSTWQNSATIYQKISVRILKNAEKIFNLQRLVKA